jgi:hypothetical protein
VSNPQLLRRILDVSSLAIVGGVLACGWWATSGIDAQPPSDNSSDRNAIGLTPDLLPQVVQIDAALVSRSLRGPLVEPPPMVAAAAMNTAPPRAAPRPRPRPRPVVSRPSLVLAGTILTSDKKSAIISDASGKFDVKSVGETLELVPAGMIVQSIESDVVVVLVQGQETRLQLDKTPPAVDPRIPPPGMGFRQ